VRRRPTASQDVAIEEDGDQYATDLQKCIKALEAHEREDPSDGEHTLVIVGGLTGRFDQTAHTVHVLHQQQCKRKRTWVASDQSLACLLPPVRAARGQ
jgi:thiamine pyrophosphokinase